jgi:hypothetical protein
MSGPFENRKSPHVSAPGPSTRPKYEGSGQYDDHHTPAEPTAEAPAETPAAPVEAAAPAPVVAAAPAAPPAAVASEASLRVLPMDLDELLGNAPTAPAPAVAPEPVAAEAKPATPVEANPAPADAKEASLSVLPVDIEALLGSKLGGV